MPRPSKASEIDWPAEFDRAAAEGLTDAQLARDLGVSPQAVCAARCRPVAAHCTVTRAAAILEVSAPTVRLWCDQGRLPHFRTAGGHRRVYLKTVRSLRAAILASYDIVEI